MQGSQLIPKERPEKKGESRFAKKPTGLPINFDMPSNYEGQKDT